jgi:hypothetical protein
MPGWPGFLELLSKCDHRTPRMFTDTHSVACWIELTLKKTRHLSLRCTITMQSHLGTLRWSGIDVLQLTAFRMVTLSDISGLCCIVDCELSADRYIETTVRKGQSTDCAVPNTQPGVLPLGQSASTHIKTVRAHGDPYHLRHGNLRPTAHAYDMLPYF